MIPVDDLEQVFESVNDEFNKFDHIPVEERPSSRPDLCAFLKLDILVPGVTDIVSWAGHDKISLGVDLETFAAIATVEDVVYLVRCGVMCDGEMLSMFA